VILSDDCVKSGQVSKFFKLLRAKRGMTIMEVSGDIGASTKTVGGVERRDNDDMYLQIFVSLANLYGYDVKLVKKEERS